MRVSKREVTVTCDACNKIIDNSYNYWTVGRDTEKEGRFEIEDIVDRMNEYKDYHFCNLECVKNWILIKGTDYEPTRPV